MFAGYGYSVGWSLVCLMLYIYFKNTNYAEYIHSFTIHLEYSVWLKEVDQGKSPIN